MGTVARSRGSYVGLIILAIFFPYISVGIEYEFCSETALINLVLSFVVPLGGMIHAFYVLHKARYSPESLRMGADGTPQALPSGYQPHGHGHYPPPPMQQDTYQQPPLQQGNYTPQQGYQAPPQQGYQAPPQQGYQAAPQQGYQAPLEHGYHSPQQGYYQAPQ